MYTISKSIEIDAGHRVPFHASQCRNLHGHRYRVTALIGAPDLVPAATRQPDAGMVLDFGVVKRVLMQVVHETADHRLLLWDQDPLVTSGPFQDALATVMIAGDVVLLPCIPTAEELAAYWGRQIDEVLRLAEPRVTLLQVAVRETPTSTAVWMAPTHLNDVDRLQVNVDVAAVDVAALERRILAR